MEPTKAEQALSLPGYLFYLERIEIPVGIEASELNDFAEISLEASSPFPIEQLFWGYLHAEEADSILLYAAHRDCVKRAGFENVNSYAWVLPDFAPLMSTFFPIETEVLVLSEASVTLLHFEKGCGVPTYANARQVTADQSADSTIKALRTLAPAASEIQEHLELRPKGHAVNEDGLATYRFDLSGTPVNNDSLHQYTEITPSSNQLWQADVRRM